MLFNSICGMQLNLVDETTFVWFSLCLCVQLGLIGWLSRSIGMNVECDVMSLLVRRNLLPGCMVLSLITIRSSSEIEDSLIVFLPAASHVEE